MHHPDPAVLSFVPANASGELGSLRCFKSSEWKWLKRKRCFLKETPVPSPALGVCPPGSDLGGAEQGPPHDSPEGGPDTARLKVARG